MKKWYSEEYCGSLYLILEHPGYKVIFETKSYDELVKERNRLREKGYSFSKLVD